MATLQPALSSVLFVLLLAHAFTAATASTLVEDTCKRFAGGDQAGHDYEYCMKTLAADSMFPSGDALGLAAHATNVAKWAAMETGARIRALQLTETAPVRRGCLDKCAAEYEATKRRLMVAARKARFGGGKQLKELQRLLAESLGAPLRCDRAFTDAGQKSPLSTADHELDEAISLALGILPTAKP